MKNKLILMVILAVSLVLVISGCKNSGITGKAVAENTAGSGSASGSQPTGNQQPSSPPAEQKTASSDGSLYKIECSKDSDCGGTVYGEKYCFQNGIVTPITKNMCINPGSVKSYCRREMADEVLSCQNGKEICRAGECLVLANQPCSDSDGGKNFEKQGAVYDAELMNYKDECLDKHHLIEYFCAGGDKGVAGSERHLCLDSDCITGACVDNTE